MADRPHSGFTRIPYTQRCRLRRGEQQVSGLLCNISVLGVYVALAEPPDVDEVVDLEFPLPGSDEPVVARAIVTWQNAEEPQKADGLPPGCGLRFSAVDPGDAARIEAIVAEYAKVVPMGVGAKAPYSGHVRVPYVHSCELVWGDALVSGVVCNLSGMGVYVTLEPLPEVGDHVTIAFLLPGDLQLFQCNATVTWQNPEQPQKVDSLPPGCGVRFDELSPEEAGRIERVVLEYCASSTLGQLKDRVAD